MLDVPETTRIIIIAFLLSMGIATRAYSLKAEGTERTIVHILAAGFLISAVALIRHWGTT